MNLRSPVANLRDPVANLRSGVVKDGGGDVLLDFVV